MSPEAITVLRALRQKRNVLLTGAPSCGKTHLMQEVVRAFRDTPAPSPASAPPRAGSGRIAIPAPAAAGERRPELPSPGRVQREVFRIAFSAITKPRHFTSAFVPAGAGGAQVARGVLLQANDAAIGGAASLLVIDELNRGPAVSLFGDAIVSIEPDKRMGDDDRPTEFSWPLQTLDAQGSPAQEYLSDHLYILAAMNEADASIEPIDVAFLRRFQRIPVVPRADTARRLIGAAGADVALPAAPSSSAEVCEAAVRAWVRVNDRIAIGRAPEYQIGHGIFLNPASPPQDLATALDRAVGWWSQIYTHVREVFFGDAVGLGIAVNAGADAAGYRLEDVPYGLDQKERIVEPTIDPQTIYALLVRVAHG